MTAAGPGRDCNTKNMTGEDFLVQYCQQSQHVVSNVVEFQCISSASILVGFMLMLIIVNSLHMIVLFCVSACVHTLWRAALVCLKAAPQPCTDGWGALYFTDVL